MRRLRAGVLLVVFIAMALGVNALAREAEPVADESLQVIESEAQSLGLGVDSAVGDDGIPFTEAERAALKKRLANLIEVDVIVGDAIARELAGRPLVPFMIELVQDEQEDVRLRCTAMYVLAMTHDSRGIPILRRIIEKPLKDEVSRDEWSLLHNAIICLGPMADDATLDFLLEMATTEYWENRNAAAATRGESPEQFRDHMQWVALEAFAASGSPRAVEMFGTEISSPELMLGGGNYSSKVNRASLLRLAKMRSKGILKVADYEVEKRNTLWKQVILALLLALILYSIVWVVSGSRRARRKRRAGVSPE